MAAQRGQGLSHFAGSDISVSLGMCSPAKVSAPRGRRSSGNRKRLSFRFTKVFHLGKNLIVFASEQAGAGRKITWEKKR